MTGIAPDASLVSTRIDWTLYFVYAIGAVVNGQEFDQDWCHGMDQDAVVLTALNGDRPAVRRASGYAAGRQEGNAESTKKKR